MSSAEPQKTNGAPPAADPKDTISANSPPLQAQQPKIPVQDNQPQKESSGSQANQDQNSDTQKVNESLEANSEPQVLSSILTVDSDDEEHHIVSNMTKDDDKAAKTLF